VHRIINLTKKVYSWNNEIGDKWVNELVFVLMVIVPVYEVTMFIDGIIINSIEFWSGDNPISYVGEDGKNYVKSGDDTYEVIKNKKQTVLKKVVDNDEESVQVIIDEKSRTAYIDNNGEITKIAEFSMEGNGLESLVVYKPTGEAVFVPSGPDMRYKLSEAWGSTDGFALAK